MSKTILAAALVLALAGCTNEAIKQAKELDSNARCVTRASDMAFCIINDQPFICDKDRCLPTGCSGAAFVEVESGTGRKGDR